MKKTLFFLVFTLIACGAAQKRNLSSVDAKAGAFQIRKHENQVLPNGLTVLWLEDNSLPYVSMQMMFKSGTSQEPVGRGGVALFVASMLDKGTPKLSAMQIAEELEQMGGGFGTDVSPDYTTASMSVLSFYKDQALELYRDILLKPTFPLAEIERLRKRRLANLLKIADQPEDFSEYLLPKFIYGSHPYGHTASGSQSSVKSIRRVDLQKFYAKNYAPGNAVLAVVGKYDEAWKKKLISTFSSWKGQSDAASEIPEFPQWKGTELLLVDRTDLNQAQIQIAFKGVPRNIPDYLEFRAATKILGESFGSRLFEEIREKRGLTYHIRAWFEPRLKTGPMGIYTFTRTDKISETVEETLNTYRRFVESGVTDQEVEEVKSLMRGQFPRSFETPEALATQLLLLNRYDVNVDYLTNFYQNLDRVTKDSVNSAIRKYFDPQNLRILVYAPKDKAETSLKKFGKLEVKGYKEFLQ